MAKKAVIGLIVAAGLVSLLIYSQQRQTPPVVSGFIEADEIRLGSRAGGRVARVFVEEGQVVQAGDKLVELETYDWDARVRKAQAELAAAQAESQRLEKGLRPEEVEQALHRMQRLQQQWTLAKKGPRPQEIAAAEARVALATAQMQRAQKSHARTSTLFMAENGTVSREDMDRATEELRVAEAMFEVRRQELATLKAGNRAEEIAAAEAAFREAEQAWKMSKAGFREEDVLKAKAAYAAAEAGLATLIAQREELKIVAPVGGVIEAVELQKGDLVSPNAPVLSMLDNSCLWVRAYVPQNRLNVELKQAVDVTVDSFAERKFQGRITFISRQAEFTPGNTQTVDDRAKQVFRIKVTLVDGHSELRPGMAADVWLQ